MTHETHILLFWLACFALAVGPIAVLVYLTDERIARSSILAYLHRAYLTAYTRAWEVYTFNRPAQGYSFAVVHPLRSFVRAILRALHSSETGAIGQIFRADVETIDGDKGKFSTVAVVPFDRVPGHSEWSKLSPREQAKRGPRTPITRYAENILAIVDRYSIMLAQFGWARSPWTIDADLARARGGHKDTYSSDDGDMSKVLDRASSLVTITAQPEGLGVSLRWSATTPVAFARVFTSWIVERPLVVRNTRGSGRTGNAADDSKGKASITGQSTARLQSWLGVKSWSWHGRSFPGTSSLARVMAYTVPVPAGFLQVCPACGELRGDNEKSCSACGCTLVKTWTSERGRLRAHWTDSDYKGRDGARRLYGDAWTTDYETVRDTLIDTAAAYAVENEVPFRPIATSTVRELNAARKMEQGC